jgi:hypothetical protein
VCTENLIRIELVMKSRHAGGDDRLDFLKVLPILPLKAGSGIGRLMPPRSVSCVCAKAVWGAAIASPPVSSAVNIADASVGARSSRTVEHASRSRVDWHMELFISEVNFGSIGLDPLTFGTHSLRRTKATLIYRRTCNLRAVQLLLGHTKIESTVRYLGVEIDDAIEIAEKIDV